MDATTIKNKVFQIAGFPDKAVTRSEAFAAYGRILDIIETIDDLDAAGLQADLITEKTLGNGTLMQHQTTFSVPSIYATGIGLTALAGGGPDPDNALTGEFNQVTTVATEDDSKTLQGAKLGLRIAIINQGANKMQVFPNTGDEIDSLGVDAAYDLLPGEKVVFLAEGDDNWESIVNDVIDLTKIRIGMREFSTLTQARDGVAAGETIIVPKGTFNENDLWNGIAQDVTWHLLDGAVIDHDGISGPNPTRALFDDEANVAGIRGRVTGNGVLKSADQSVSFNGIVRVSFAATEVSMQAKSYESGDSCMFWIDADGKMDIRAEEDIIQNVDTFGCLLTLTGGEVNVFARKIEQKDPGAVGGNLADFSGGVKAFIRVQEILTNTPDIMFITAEGAAIDVQIEASKSIINTSIDLFAKVFNLQTNTDSNSTITINSPLIQGSCITTGEVIRLNGDAFVNIIFDELKNAGTGKTVQLASAGNNIVAHFQGRLIESLSQAAILGDGAGSVNVTFDVREIKGAKVASNPGAVTLEQITSGLIEFLNCTIIDTAAGSSNALHLRSTLATAFVIEMSSCRFVSNSTAEVVRQIGGTLRLRNTRIENLDANAGSDGLNKTGGVIDLDGGSTFLAGAGDSFNGSGVLLVKRWAANTGIDTVTETGGAVLVNAAFV